MNIRYTCAICGTTKTAHHSRQKTARFCSRPCQAAAKRQAALSLRPDATKLKDGSYAVALRDGRKTLVNAEDLDAVSAYPWFATKRGYVVTPGWGTPRRQIKLHRFIMERALSRPLRADEVVDHKKGNKLDNRRSKLRAVTQQENMMNQIGWSKGTESGYKGVYRNPPGWKASICLNQIHIYIGTFVEAIEAAWMYDQYALQLHGEFAYTNFDYIAGPAQ